ncbi:MAG: ACT domain-containing protein, partial [Hyphomicrobiales bacterium]|nr:ACT domain-containing protein [Hyphomicrobiales bacterium]
GDIADVARGNISLALAHPAAGLMPNVRARMRAHEGGYYIRLSVHDRPGAFASIAQRMAAESISLQSIVQKKARKAKTDHAVTEQLARVIIITHKTSEAAIRKALEAIEEDGHVANKPQMIRIERL